MISYLSLEHFEEQKLRLSFLAVLALKFPWQWKARS